MTSHGIRLLFVFSIHLWALKSAGNQLPLGCQSDEHEMQAFNRHTKFSRGLVNARLAHATQLIVNTVIILTNRHTINNSNMMEHNSRKVKRFRSSTVKRYGMKSFQPNVWGSDVTFVPCHVFRTVTSHVAEMFICLQLTAFGQVIPKKIKCTGKLFPLYPPSTVVTVPSTGRRRDCSPEIMARN